MKVKKKQLSKIISDKDKIFGGLIVLVLVFTFGLIILGKGTYSLDNNTDALIIDCPEGVKKGSQIECSIVLNSVSIVTYGISAKYEVSDGLEFVSFKSRNWEEWTNNKDGFVLVNLTGVTDDTVIGTVIWNVPVDAVSNTEYDVSLVDGTIGDGEDETIVFETSSDSVRVLSDVNTLNKITLSSGELNEDFNKDIGEYTADINSDEVIIEVEKTDDSSVVSGDFGKQKIHYGTNKFEIVVTSEDGNERKYVINIYREYEFSSDVYVYDKEDNYLYTGMDTEFEVILDKINVPSELSASIEANKLVISYEEEKVKEIDLVNISSSVYDLTDGYLYVGANKLDLSDIDIVNGDLVIEDNRLKVMVGNDKLNEFSILSISFNNLILSDKIINLDYVMVYDEFIKLIRVSDGLSVKVYDGIKEITTGNIETGLRVEIYYGDIKLDAYEISSFNFMMSDELSVDEEFNYIKYIKVGTTVAELLDKITISGGTVDIYKDSEYKEKKNNNDVIATGDVLVISSQDDIKSEYTLSVSGDCNGDGKLDMIDIVLLRRHYVGWVDPNTNLVQKRIGVYRHALDFNEDGNVDMIDIVLMRRTYVGLI